MKRIPMLAAMMMLGCGGLPPDSPTVGVEESALRCNHGNPNPGIVPPDSRAYGQDYAAWAADWEQWALSPPAAFNPVYDNTGANCGYGQKGPVWFLAGNGGGVTTRHCTVPAGKALFFPLIDFAYFAFDTDPPPNTYPDLLPVVAGVFAGATASAEIDGRAVKNTADYEVVSDGFPIVLAPDNIFGVGPPDCRADRKGLIHCPVALNQGIFLLVEPLRPGNHTIHFKGTMPNSNNFTGDVTYELRVR